MKHHLNAIIISLSAIIGVLLLTHAFKHRHASNDIIHVTGLGKKDFKSDLIVWNGSFTRKSYELKTAYELLKKIRKASEII